MSTQKEKPASLNAENIGGIDETSVQFTPGVTILTGENATNRTSLLQTIMAALGSDEVTMKGDAEEASVELEIGGETYTRELTRQGSTIRTGGDPYLDDPTLADLFAFLLESNEARRTVAADGDLRDLIMRPIDTDEIQRDIDRLVERRRELEEELEELDSLKDRLPSLEERRTSLQEEIEETEAELAAKEEELENRDTDVEETRAEKAELEERFEELRSKRSDLEDVRYDLETERETLESARAETRELQSELDDLPDAPVGEIDELESRIDDLREQKRQLESEVNEVQSVVRFNQEMLDDGDEDVLDALEESADDVTEELLPDGNVTCWTCGSEVPEDQIEATVDRLQELSQSKLGEVDDIETRMDELTEEARELREKQRRREDLQRRLEEAESEVERAEDSIERLTDRREELRDEVEDLEAEIERMEDETYEEVLDLHKEANQIEYDLGRLEGDLEDVESEITEIEDRLDEEDRLKDRREELDEEIEELRTKIGRIERQAVEEFNEHMETVLELLEYHNLERIWLERVEKEVREGRRKVTKSVFELHIIRQTDGGATYEDTVDHLSESEREVTGLVFALAGYLTHEVYDEVPFLLLDSLEAIDADRIATLVEYLEGYNDHLVVALLSEDAAGLSEEYQYVGDI
ncbi:archaea-specific SMC-related protein [Natronomonas marina]|jgi:DNA repair exonuclease SbcCD ATPase subunit|uniref:archaea-specific SMC-related protein n=1 Tax=Natronomonas marina TaxID=2961939 RepID=UPI0020C9BE49|nr:archaea-specific SMC-related protein [Natronomonas marina]